MTVATRLRASTSLTRVRPPPVTTPTNLRSGQIPTVWDPNWQKYSQYTGGKLTPAQIAAFEAMPEDLANYATAQVTNADVVPITHSSGIVVTPALNGASVKFSLPGKDIHTAAATDIAAAHSEYVARWQSLQTKLSSITAGINAKTITTRAQIDAEYKAS